MNDTGRVYIPDYQVRTGRGPDLESEQVKENEMESGRVMVM